MDPGLRSLFGDLPGIVVGWVWSAARYLRQRHDLSSLGTLEQGGAIYHDNARHNMTSAAENILGNGGMNTVTTNYHIYLDLHLSDNWADPQHDYAPAAWPTTLDALASIVRTYARENLTTFHHVGVPLSLISLGNEIRHGMLWPLGEANVDITPTSARVANFTNLATLRASARSGLDDAVNAGATKPQVLSHIDNGWNLTLQQNWFSALTGSGKLSVPDWDVFSVSLDLFYGTNATLANLKRRLNGLAAHMPDVPELSEPGFSGVKCFFFSQAKDLTNSGRTFLHGLGADED
ncbi:glycoside hydrolase family 53 protein [Lepidopterella palustris CBS 459.81]|uniref:Arabinogalactan endo-beta-1,4-galactanase n=1 Tax=Lepidopterella palustris CBS 459.81 TaxID=1314670 RepID=A0A8E2JE88_9PEZI|nr:glycoside hydrolase family 53 protein [Lepidopterella palustris CBS 459.81]